jgi:hypothetical protein
LSRPPNGRRRPPTRPGDVRSRPTSQSVEIKIVMMTSPLGPNPWPATQKHLFQCTLPGVPARMSATRQNTICMIHAVAFYLPSSHQPKGHVASLEALPDTSSRHCRLFASKTFLNSSSTTACVVLVITNAKRHHQHQINKKCMQGDSPSCFPPPSMLPTTYLL